jgi:hypothetical protein
MHPQYLDGVGLVALWREALLAQAVLRGRTRGYRQHPQLERFRDSPTPVATIAEYLRGVHAESRLRGYAFARERIVRGRATSPLAVARGQLDHEWEHLMRKLRSRAPDAWRRLQRVSRPQAHPLFRVTRGGLASWERT